VNIVNIKKENGGIKMLSEEVVIKLIGKLTLMYPSINQLEVRDMMEEVLNDYEIGCKEKSLVKSDLPERIQYYLAVKRLDGRSEKTLKNYNLDLLQMADYIVKPINMITTTDLRIYLATIKNTKKLKDTTMETKINNLKAFFSWLKSEDIITKDPSEKIAHPKVDKNLRKSLSVEELERLRDACDTTRRRAMVEFMFSTGLRVEEFHNVNKSDLNWDNGTLVVKGKGRKERLVYFSPKAKLYLRRYLVERTDNESALFATSKFPIGRLGVRGIQTEIKKIAKLAGFDKSVFPHLFRHTFSVLSLESGASPNTLQKILGHSSPSTTQIYARISDTSVREEYRKFMSQ
jgi:integrase/recombinase XerD